MMKVMHSIEGDSKKFKITPWKSRQPTLEFMNYIKGGKKPVAEVGKYVYDVREGKSRESRQYVRIQLSVDYNGTWEYWYTAIRGRWTKKG